MGNIQGGRIVRSNEKRLPKTIKRTASTVPQEIRPTLQSNQQRGTRVGKTGIYLDDDCATFASYLIRVRLSVRHTAPRFIDFAMNAPEF